jgi:hypothetical protein
MIGKKGIKKNSREGQDAKKSFPLILRELRRASLGSYCFNFLQSEAKGQNQKDYHQADKPGKTQAAQVYLPT